MKPPTRQLLFFWMLIISCYGCHSQQTNNRVLRLAAGTTTRDSGLLEKLLTPFETNHQIRVDVIAVGTEKALMLGEFGDVDVLLVHHRQAEDAFMSAQHGIRREDVMYNSFELLGPQDDPAQVKGLEITSALERIARSGAPFLSRGDQSGTHQRELLLWEEVAVQPDWPAYQESGQGMGATLTIADEFSAYVLTDRGTFLNFQDKIDLVPLVPHSESLRNAYGVIVVNPAKHPAVRADLADKFASYIISPAAQQIIADYGKAGEQLFVPLRLPEVKP